MKTRNSLLLIVGALFTAAAPAMDREQKYLLHQKFGSNKKIDVKKCLEQKDFTKLHEIYQAQQMLQQLNFKEEKTLLQEISTTEYRGGVLNPLYWLNYYFSSPKQQVIEEKIQASEIVSPGFDWENPYTIKSDGGMQINRRGKAHHLTVAGEGFVDVHHIESRDKAICYKPEDGYERIAWSPDGTCCAVIESGEAEIFDLKNDKRRRIACGSDTVDYRPLRNFDEDDIRFFARFEDHIAITEVRDHDEKPIIISRDKCKISDASLRGTLLVVCFSDNSVVIYDHNANYKPVLEIKGEKQVRLGYNVFERELLIPYIPIFVDDHLKLFDKKTLKEAYSQKQVVTGTRQIYLNWNSWNEKPYTHFLMTDNRTEGHVTFMHDILNKRVVKLESENDSELGFGGFSPSNLCIFNLNMNKEEKFVAKIYDPKKNDGQPVKKFVIENDDLLAWFIFPENDWLVFPVAGNKVELYDVKNNKSFELAHDGKMFDHFGNGRYFAWTTADKNVLFLDIRDQSKKYIKVGQSIYRMQFDRKNAHLAVFYGDALSLYDAATGKEIVTIDMKSSIKNLQFNKDGDYCAVVTENKPEEIIIFDVKNGYKPVKTLKFESDGQFDFWEGLFYVKADGKYHFYMRGEATSGLDK